jgi:hypothetical protein
VKEEEKQTKMTGGGAVARPAVLADGTYATQTAAVESVASATTPNLRALLLSGRGADSAS